MLKFIKKILCLVYLSTTFNYSNALCNSISNFDGNCKRFIIPKVGKIYYKNFKVPLIGNQKIQTEIKTDNLATIKLEGIINELGTIRYFKLDTDKPLIRLSPNLKKIVKTFNIEYSIPYYDYENDRIIFIVNIKTINYKTEVIMDYLYRYN